MPSAFGKNFKKLACQVDQGWVQGQYTDAESLLLAGYLGAEKQKDNIPESKKFLLREMTDHLIELYLAIDRPADVEKWQHAGIIQTATATNCQVA